MSRVAQAAQVHQGNKTANLVCVCPAACQRGLTVGFVTAADLINQLTKARDAKRLLRLQSSLAKL